MPENEEEYELMPHRTISELKHELEILKKKVGSQEEISSKEVQQSIKKLNDNINKLLLLFQEAAETMEKEEAEPGVKELIGPLVQRIDRIEDENKKIAEAILAVADMVKDVKEGEKKIEEELPKIEEIQKQAPPPPPSRPAPSPRPALPPGQQPAPGPGPVHNPPKREGPEKSSSIPYMPQSPQPRPIPPAPSSMPPRRGAGPSGTGMPPYPRPASSGPSPLPPMPELKPESKKKGFFSKLLKK